MANLLPLLLIFVLDAVPAPSPSPAVRSKPCAGPEHRQLDFWVGDWDVFTPDGKLAGRNTITREYGGCVVQERWLGAGGMAGSSFNTFDAGAGRWHQTWVDASGTLLLLDGVREGDDVVLEGEMRQKDGPPVRHFLRLTAVPGGGVRQLWRTTTDGGKSWSVVFEGTYVRRNVASK